MRRPDAGAPERLSALQDAVTAWASTLTDEQRARETRRPGQQVAGLVGRTRARRPAADGAALAELGAVQDTLALADAVPEERLEVPRASLAAAVRTSLARLEAAHPGHLVEVRVPPWGAVQIGMPGVASVHRRGTPPNVVETDAATWLALVGGSLGWADAVASHRVSASGAHAQLGDLPRQA